MSDQNSQLVTFVHDLQTVRMLSLASTVAMGYNFMLSFPDELKFIWLAPWSKAKILFMACRYPPLCLCVAWIIYNLGFNGPMHNFCVGVSAVENWGWLIAVPMQVVLAIRAFAIWQCDRRVAGVLLLGMCSYWIALVFCSIKAAIGTRYAPSVLTTVLRECYSTASLTGTPKEIKLAFGALLSLDGIMFFLILLRALITDRTSRIQIVNVLLRDGTIYYSVIFVLSIANVVLTTTLPFERVVLSISVSNALLAAQSIGASHIILCVREYSFEGHSAPSLSQSTMRFADRRTLIEEFTSQALQIPLDSNR